jgi:hypothetical protein
VFSEPEHISGDNLNNTRCEVSRHFKNKMLVNMKDMTKNLATNSMNKNIRSLFKGIN